MARLNKINRENMQFLLLEFVRFHIDSVLLNKESLDDALNEIYDYLDYIEDLK